MFKKNILITGTNGFISSNLKKKLAENSDYNILTYVRGDTLKKFRSVIEKSDFIFHLAGVNRPEKLNDFIIGNINLTESICNELSTLKKNVPIVYSSSIHANNKEHESELHQTFSYSKIKSENILKEYSEKLNSQLFIYRLPNVFGKNQKPNYNSVVSTFCYNKANNLPINIHDPDKILNLVHIDDVIESFKSKISFMKSGLNYEEVDRTYQISLQDLAEYINSFDQIASANKKLKNDNSKALKNLISEIILDYQNRIK